MGSSGWFLRVWFVAILFVGFIGFLLLGVLESGYTKATTSIGNFKYFEIERGRHAVHPYFDSNYLSKRRVPNGPDPIHNRKAGDSRRPPGRP